MFNKQVYIMFVFIYVNIDNVLMFNIVMAMCYGYDYFLEIKPT